MNLNLPALQNKGNKKGGFSALFLSIEIPMVLEIIFLQKIMRFYQVRKRADKT